jgi:hypothetical protein
MIAREAMAPPRDMVREVENIIEGYAMGPLRALAQEPPQNSKDASRSKTGLVSVEFRLLRRRAASGQHVDLLTVTDAGTHGLRGRPLAPQDLTADLVLPADANWPAWEAMGYTKEDQDSLGSRGQGKAAFLYHSEARAGDRASLSRQMIMLYDTLLEDGTYRLGGRIARPDNIVTPPYEGDEAAQTIRSSWQALGVEVPLELQPLETVGTRVIVPFVSEEAVTALRTGEFAQWLERLWWRSIQLGRLEITVVDEEMGTATPIRVPAWWQDFDERNVGAHAMVERDLVVDEMDGLRIKRLALLWDPTLEDDDIPHVSSQYQGVQYLRHGQWIETRDTAKEFADIVPEGKRPGFRGFVEFERETERRLREMEMPQHDRFSRRPLLVRTIDQAVDQAVRTFAEKQGWTKAEPRGPADSDAVGMEELARLAEQFVGTGSTTGTGRPDLWACHLDLGYPTAGTTRVELDETLEGVSADCRFLGAGEPPEVRVVLQLVTPSGRVVDVADRKPPMKNRVASHTFGDLRVVGHGDPPLLPCPESGRYALRLRCLIANELVCTARAVLHVRCDPPPPPDPSLKPFLLRFDVVDAGGHHGRVDPGQMLPVTALVATRLDRSTDLTVDISLGNKMLVDQQTVRVAPTPRGGLTVWTTIDTPSPRLALEGTASAAEVGTVALPPGPHAVRIDVRDPQGQVVLHASRTIYFNSDPPGGNAAEPFVIEANEKQVSPMWQLRIRPAPQPWILRFARQHPIYAESAAAGGLALERWWSTTICEALLEWATSRMLSGDSGGFDVMRDRIPMTASPEEEQYVSKLDELQQRIDSGEDVVGIQTATRDALSLMLCLRFGSPLGATANAT